MTQKEYEELRDALKHVNVHIPIKQYPDEEFSNDQIRELLQIMRKSLDENPELYKDKPYADEYEALQALAGFRGITI